MPVAYLSEAWAEKALACIETDAAVREAVRGIELSILTIILNAPKDAYGFLYVAFNGTGLQEYRVGHEYAAVTQGIPEPTFVVSGDYSVFAEIQQGRLTERRALLTKRLHLTGSLIKALRYLKALEAVTAAMRTIPCTV